MLLFYLCASRNSQLFFHTVTEAQVARRAPMLVDALHVEGNELFKYYLNELFKYYLNIIHLSSAA